MTEGDSESINGVPAMPTSLDPLTRVRADHACFGCGAENPIGLRLRFETRETEVTAPFLPRAEHQGFEGVVHGGIISTVLDEAMAWAAAADGAWAYTAEMRVRFRHPLLVGEATRVSARVTARKRRVLSVTAELVRKADNICIASAEATFFEADAGLAASWRERYLGTETIAGAVSDTSINEMRLTPRSSYDEQDRIGSAITAAREVERGNQR